MFAKHTENFVDDNKLNHKWRKDMTVPHEDILAKTRVKNLSYHKIFANWLIIKKEQDKAERGSITFRMFVQSLQLRVLRP